jgi:cytochrome c5
LQAEENRGRTVYQHSCLACHGADGAGMMPGVPDFSEPRGVLTKPDTELLRNMITGIQSPGSPMAMPPKGGNPALTEKELKEALNYIRRTFGP